MIKIICTCISTIQLASAPQAEVDELRTRLHGEEEERARMGHMHAYMYIHKCVYIYIYIYIYI